MFAFDHSRKEKEPVVAEAVEEVKTEPVLVCPPLRSQAYTPPDDLQSRLESCLKEVLGSPLPSNWQDISLDDGHVKFRLLSHLADDLGHAVPNSRLHQMCRVGDVLDFYNVPSIQDRSKFDELIAGNLPPNLKISWGYWAGQQLTALRCCTLLTEVADKPCEVLPFRTLLKPPFLYCFVFSCRRIHLFFLMNQQRKRFHIC